MTIDVYQDVYDVISAQMVSAEAKPFVRTENVEGLKEFQAFKKLLDNGAADRCDHIGLFSVKFPNKMRITVAEAKAFVTANPGYDVYLFNPYPYESYLFFNQWESGDFHHPGIKQLASILAERFGLGEIEAAPRMRVEDNVFCNYWIGTSSFFKEYVTLMTKIADAMFEQREKFLQNTWHMDQIGTPFFTFILERMLAAMLKRDQGRFRALSYPVHPELYGSMIADDSPVRFEKKRRHFLAVREQIEMLDRKFSGVDYDPTFKSEFVAINDRASRLISDGIEKLYSSENIASPTSDAPDRRFC